MISVEELSLFCTSLFTLALYQQVNGTVLSTIQPPDTCLLDLIYWDLFCLICTLEFKIPILMLSFGNTTATILIVGLDKLGGRGDVSTKAGLLAEQTGRGLDEIITEIVIYFIPGYNLNFNSKVLSASHAKQGPDFQSDREQSSNKDAVKMFLDRMLQECGEKSVIYASLLSIKCPFGLNLTKPQVLFGSIYWPLNVEASWKVIEIIYEKRLPMILVHNDEYGRPPIPESLRAQLEAEDSVLISTWVPQNLVLGHKSDARLFQYQIRIAWPIDADQPINAIYIGDLKHKVGYKLLEVLQRDKSKPLYRGYTPSGTLNAIEEEFRTVLQNAFGHDGAMKRRNAEMFKEKLSCLWNEDGDARMELRRFIKDYLSWCWDTYYLLTRAIVEHKVLESWLDYPPSKFIPQ
ncbi:hypothetical protein Clacol_007023 [Clathrus columnatus]|uniref:Uncharacterized protein n=1 Tax=Clathrus columnatus TaxID=1419009 RepID=A0AAV5AJC7_9AGAM|nr:hypothetical protein Clacol_007023 [Clathrus columnatus]